MLGWALRCLSLTVIVGATFIGLQPGGIFNPTVAPDGEAAKPLPQVAG